MSRKAKEEFYRFFSVTDVRTHDKGHTEYKVTARFVSKRCPEDVKEVVVWKRYSELKKLHGELAYTHKNLFRKEEEFPPFPPAQVFGRFDEAVIEQRRKATETMLVFAASIPALYNSPQLNEFFRGGDVTRPLDPSDDTSSGALPPPLIPLPERRDSDCEPAEEEVGREAPILPQDLGNNLRIDMGEPEVAVEAFGEIGEEGSQDGLDDGVTSLVRTDTPQESEEEAKSLDAATERCSLSPNENSRLPLSDDDLAVFDPCFKRVLGESHGDRMDLSSLAASGPETEAAYLNRAAAELTSAEASETAGDVGTAICKYRTVVDILITGVKDDPDAARRESVKRRIAHYLEHAEKLLDGRASTAHDL
ncbi:sorting nexin-15 isoform X1 [Corythoichthys intestinalis]|uniref:sorting nexin-15 isoform X1 n=1 Tax=Corythoichthys intestinalis TaxID=161448 RepID=UPI0025A55DB8|nr:sorting nexin-15 isoform X1 [Corythoichthys intestinalis]